MINVPIQQAEERVEIVSNFSFLILAQIGLTIQEIQSSNSDTLF